MNLFPRVYRVEHYNHSHTTLMNALANQRRSDESSLKHTVSCWVCAHADRLTQFSSSWQPFSQESEVTSAQGKISSVTGLRLLYQFTLFSNNASYLFCFVCFLNYCYIIYKKQTFYLFVTYMDTQTADLWGNVNNGGQSEASWNTEAVEANVSRLRNISTAVSTVAPSDHFQVLLWNSVDKETVQRIDAL